MLTILGPEINSQIDRYLQKVIKYLVNEVGDNLVSIILFGGFGKGEGSVEIVDGRAIPFNDFDIYIVVKKKLAEKKLSELMIGASQAIGFGGLDFIEHPGEPYDRRKFFHVDVRDIQHSKLKYLGRTQRTFELKYNSQVIWGNKKVLGLIPVINENDLPLAEGIRNLLNKINTQVLAIKPFLNYYSPARYAFDKAVAGGDTTQYHNGSIGDNISIDQKKIFIFYCAKSYLSMVEALLISAGKFKPSYQERVKVFKEIFDKELPEIKKQIPDLIKKIDWALDLKLRLNWDLDRDLLNLWFETRDDMMVIFNYLLLRDYPSKRDNPYSCSDYDDIFYNKLPFVYFTTYLEDKLAEYHLPKFLGRYLWWLQYYLNVLYFRKMLAVCPERSRSVGSWQPATSSSESLAVSVLFNWRDVGLRLAPPLLWLFLSFEKNAKVNKQYLEKAKSSTGKIIGEKNVKKDFDDLYHQILSYFGVYYMQRLL